MFTRNDWWPIPKPKLFLLRRSFLLASVEHLACRSRKVWFPQIKLFIMHLVLQLQSIICVHKILFCLLLDSFISCDPIEALCSIFLILFTCRLLLLHSEIMPLLFFSTILVPTQILCEIASTSKGSHIDDRSSNHYYYACHFIYLQL